MKKLLSKIMGFFTKNNPKSNKIILEINPQTNPLLLIDIQNMTKDSALQLGELFYLLNNGRLQQTIVDALTSFASDSSEKYQFIETLLIHWESSTRLGKKNQDSSAPVIKPTKVFRRYE